VGQGAVEVRRLGRERDFRGRLPRRAGRIVRRSAYIAPGVVLMPSFVNLGAYVDSGTMVDTWATVGSCAQIGKNCHISGGAGIGGVLEPLQAGPVIIEDNCFIGARAEVAEGVVVGEGSVLSMGVYLGASTKIVDRATGEIHAARCRPIRSSSPAPAGQAAARRPARGPNLYCAVIVKRSTSRPAPRPASTNCCGTDPAIYIAIGFGIRRLNDRNKSNRWLLLFYLGPLALFFGAHLTDGSAAAGVLSTAGLVVLIWAIVELGAVRGSIGVNPHGPDPVAPKPAQH
jgi:hypothetical protein